MVDFVYFLLGVVRVGAVSVHTEIHRAAVVTQLTLGELGCFTLLEVGVFVEIVLASVVVSQLALDDGVLAFTSVPVAHDLVLLSFHEAISRHEDLVHVVGGDARDKGTPWSQHDGLVVA